METIYFQPKGISPQYCEVGMIHESDPEHIWYLNEPCKILISDVKIIQKENVTYEKKVGHISFSKVSYNVEYMASWGLKCATLSSHDKVN